VGLTPAAKGFKPKRTLYRLDFSGSDLEGLEVDARGASMKELIDLLQGADAISELTELDEGQDAGKIAEQLREMVAPFARKLHAWNLLDDDDEPVPASLDGLLSQDLDFIVALMGAYGQIMTQAPPPLPAGSSSGATSQEELAAAAALSRSPES
jgi:hypothetical protein